MSSQIALLTESIGDGLGACAAQARERLTLVAPFIKLKALERLIQGVGASVRLTVMTRWAVDEIRAGVSDLAVLDFTRNRPGSRLLLHPKLHAKVLLADDALAAVGSANITDAALGFAESPNAEVTVTMRPVPNSLFLFLLRLERESVLATEELRQRFEEAVRCSPPLTICPTVQVNATPRLSLPLFPHFRTPEGLHRGYGSVLEFGDHETRAAVLEDLDALSLPEGLEEPQFRKRVGVSLLEMGLVAAFDEFVRQQRHFGEMAEWLRSRPECAGLESEQRKRYLQTLIRWLLHFLPDRYSLTEANYSERFGHVEQ